MRRHDIFAALYDSLNRPLEDLSGGVLGVGAGTGVNLRYFRRRQ